MKPSMLRPRVAHLYRRFRPDFTGDGIYYERLIPLMAERGSAHQVLVFETPAPQEDVRQAPGSAGQIEYLTDPSGKRSRLALLRWIIRHRADFDVLHIHTHVDRLFLSYLAARLGGWKVIYSSTLEDTAEELASTYRAIYRPLVRKLFSLVNIFVGISPRLYSGNSRNITASRARLIPQGVSLQQKFVPGSREKLRTQMGFQPDDIVLLYLGSISARKGIQFLVEAFDELRKVRPQLRLVLVGPVLEAEYGERIHRMIRERGLSSAVTHVDFITSPDRYYAAADIFVFASLSEGFGNVLLEAMSFGLPVVSRYLDGVTDAFIEDGRTGYLFSHPAQFRAAVLALTDDAQLRRELGDAARQTVEERFQIGAIATRYTALYREVAGEARSEPAEAAATALTLRGCASVAQGPTALGFHPVDVSPGRPVLMAVIDTESEFDWSKGVAADRGTVRSIERLESVQRIFEKFGLRPCYVVDYPVVTGVNSSRIMREMVARGAEIGAHLQPWTTPPFVEPIDNRHAFPGNLPEWLERQKLLVLRNAIENAFGFRPRVYKAGRYGISASTLRLLEEFGFDVDLSVAPGFNYSGERGPDFTRFESGLYTFGTTRHLLEIPTTSGFVGPLRFGGSRYWSAINSRALRWTHLPGILDRTHLFSRVRLSPEGYDQERMRKFTAALLKRRCRYFTLSFHSSSLQPGYTPYSKTEEQVTQLLRRIEDYLTFFRDEIGGIPGSPLSAFASEIDQTKRRAVAPSAVAA